MGIAPVYTDEFDRVHKFTRTNYSSDTVEDRNLHAQSPFRTYPIPIFTDNQDYNFDETYIIKEASHLL